ncbi:MAG: hypothetical protein IJ829_00365, partial [Kiritimatiellae bacterium]|nr:hypothetical protein [Kiritimatiellia bacterium]
MTKGKTRCAALIAALAALFVGAVRADMRELVTDRHLVTWTGSPDVIYLLGGAVSTEAAYDELVLKFTSTTAANTLAIDESVKANARLLLVGGGGAGG